MFYFRTDFSKVHKGRHQMKFLNLPQLTFKLCSDDSTMTVQDTGFERRSFYEASTSWHSSSDVSSLQSSRQFCQDALRHRPGHAKDTQAWSCSTSVHEDENPNFYSLKQQILKQI